MSSRPASLMYCTPHIPQRHLGLWILALEIALIGLNSGIVQAVTVSILQEARQQSRITRGKAFLIKLNSDHCSDIETNIIICSHSLSFILNLKEQLLDDFLWVGEVTNVSFKRQIHRLRTDIWYSFFVFSIYLLFACFCLLFYLEYKVMGCIMIFSYIYI